MLNRIESQIIKQRVEMLKQSAEWLNDTVDEQELQKQLAEMNDVLMVLIEEARLLQSYINKKRPLPTKGASRWGQ